MSFNEISHFSVKEKTAKKMNQIIKTVDDNNLKKRHINVNDNEFKIIGRTYKNSKWKREETEALLIKQHRRILNAQKQSVPLKL